MFEGIIIGLLILIAFLSTAILGGVNLINSKLECDEDIAKLRKKPCLGNPSRCTKVLKKQENPSAY